jgi:hypothetical protein
MVADCQSRFTSLAADRVSAALPLPTSLPKTRVGGSRACASGRLSRRGRFHLINTPGLRACAYKTASGRGKWPNRDPLGDDGSLAIMTAGLLTKPDSGKVNALSDDEAFSLWSAINRNLYNFVDNNPVNEVDPLGLDPNTELAVAIARGDTEAIQSILDAVADDDVSAAMRKSAQDALNKLRSKAGDWISKQCKGGINREFPDQFRNDTLEDIKNAAKAGDKAAKKAWKLLNDSRFKK